MTNTESSHWRSKFNAPKRVYGTWIVGSTGLAVLPKIMATQIITRLSGLSPVLRMICNHTNASRDSVGSFNSGSKSPRGAK